jgi:hypothetical protein
LFVAESKMPGGDLVVWRTQPSTVDGLMKELLKLGLHRTDIYDLLARYVPEDER